MRKFLLDSHALIWFFEDDQRLPKQIKNMLEDADSQVFVSVASLWEIAIKKSLQKLTLRKSIPEMFEECEAQDIEILPVARPEIEMIEALPFHHRDPFDRVIIATAISRKLETVSADVQF
ncbi:MAG: type II toxin-antitoxin system VapC family toxin [Saprospiraceae bacterium]